MKWQSIETAPEYERILVCGGNIGEVNTAVRTSKGVICEIGEDRRISSDPPDYPTHWMPLPEPPEAV